MQTASFTSLFSYTTMCVEPALLDNSFESFLIDIGIFWENIYIYVWLISGSFNCREKGRNIWADSKNESRHLLFKIYANCCLPISKLVIDREASLVFCELWNFMQPHVNISVIMALTCRALRVELLSALSLTLLSTVALDLFWSS